MDKESLFVRQAQYVGGAVFNRGADEPFQLDLHRHELFSEMLLIEEGEGEFVVGDRSYHAVPGTLLIYQQGVWHRERSTAYPFRATYVSFCGLKLRELPEHYFLPADRDPVIALGDLHAAFSGLMIEAIAVWNRREPEYALLAGNLIGMAMAKLAQRVYYPQGTDSAVIAAGAKSGVVLTARRYMEENFRSPVTLDELAAVTYSNKYHLAHLFKAEAGVSPIQFLISCRIEAAGHYLRSTRLSVRQIAELVGYQSETSFYKVFMKTTGVTPLQYRERG